VTADLEPERLQAPDHGDVLDALRRERRVSQALREVGTALGTTLDLDDLLELILGKLTYVIEADRATLYLLDDSKNELVSRIVVGGEVRSIRMKVGHGIAGRVAQSGETIRIRDAYQDPRFEREWDILTGYRTTNLLAAPLKNHVGRTIGVIQVLNKHVPEGFTEDDEAIVSALSTQAAVAIDNSRLFLSLIQKNKQLIDTKEQLERKFRDLSLLLELERATARATSIDELVRATLSQVTGACDARGGALLLADDETGDMTAYLFDREQPETAKRRGQKLAEGVLGAAMQAGEPVLIPDATNEPAAQGYHAFTPSSVLALALEGEGRALGALGVFAAEGERGLSDEDVGLLRLVAANVSTAVRLFNANRTRELSERLTSIGRLLSQVVHDFKTPMTVISGYAQLMADADDRETRHEYSELILKQFDTLTSMQREVLEFARGESTLFVRRVYVKKFLSQIEEQLKLEVQGTPVQVAVSCDSKLVARLDEGRVLRAIHNLARNAIEAMGETGGTLTIRAERAGDDLVITVGDTGPGIPKEIEDRLFQSFVTAGKQGGTGLGLAIVKKIVEEHGGRVEVRSSDAGALFSLYFPQAHSRPRSSLESERPPEA
jgi:signal transduction histidine kinase/putative methionine-R-sulfoxide reductase with GAF domain